MSRIRGKNTFAEQIVFKFLSSKGIYFQKHYKRAPGCPDVALPRKKLAVFIDGDFWHGRDLGKATKRLPTDFWKNKIIYNYERDRKNEKTLTESGWKILRVWESDIKRKRSRDEVLGRIEDFLTLE